MRQVQWIFAPTAIQTFDIGNLPANSPDTLDAVSTQTGPLLERTGLQFNGAGCRRYNIERAALHAREE